MKATLNKDRISFISANSETEIPNIPAKLKRIGLERLRFTGSEIVDLADLSEMWVEQKGQSFILHAVEFPGTQKVIMDYTDRRRLVNDAGTYRLLSLEELEEENAKMELARIKARNKLLIRDGDFEAVILTLIAHVIVYVRTQDKTIEQLFDDLTPMILEGHPLAEKDGPLQGILSRLEEFMENGQGNLRERGNEHG